MGEWSFTENIGELPSGTYIVEATVSTDLFGPLYNQRIFTVTAHADLNGDGVVNIQDLVIAAKTFGSRPGDSNWNPVADLNRDNKVDILDLVIVARNIGGNT